MRLYYVWQKDEAQEWVVVSDSVENAAASFSGQAVPLVAKANRENWHEFAAHRDGGWAVFGIRQLGTIELGAVFEW